MINSLQDYTLFYWRYFLALEEEYLEIEKIIPVDCLNENTFSMTYMKLLFSICSEIDILCKEFIEYFTGGKIKRNEENLKNYSIKLTQRFPNFANEIIDYSKDAIKKQLKPFDNWNIQNTTPVWWDDYNAIKHKRTILSGNVQNYKKANQKNILDALGGLYQLEMYFFKEIIDKEDPTEKLRMPVPQSKRFRINNWRDNVGLMDNRYIVYINDAGHLIFSGEFD
jgi:hypothetical protein